MRFLLFVEVRHDGKVRAGRFVFHDSQRGVIGPKLVQSSVGKAPATSTPWYLTCSRWPRRSPATLCLQSVCKDNIYTYDTVLFDYKLFTHTPINLDNTNCRSIRIVVYVTRCVSLCRELLTLPSLKQRFIPTLSCM